MKQTSALDENSPYAYLLLCTDFAETGAVAEGDGGLAGFVLGYRPPARPESYFVWQIGVANEARGQGLGHALLEWVVDRARPLGVRFLEATVTPSNHASQALFEAFARRTGSAVSEETAFAADLFPGADHEAEVRIRIGPLNDPSRESQEYT